MAVRRQCGVRFALTHGIVDQSLHARMGAEPTNGEGFGLGWYGSGSEPAVYRSVFPAWADRNLRELAAHSESPLFLAHVRAAIGSPVQETRGLADAVTAPAPALRSENR